MNYSFFLIEKLSHDAKDTDHEWSLVEKHKSYCFNLLRVVFCSFLTQNLAWVVAKKIAISIIAYYFTLAIKYELLFRYQKSDKD